MDRRSLPLTSVSTIGRKLDTHETRWPVEGEEGRGRRGRRGGGGGGGGEGEEGRGRRGGGGGEVWTDGRYHLQASQQLDTNWTLMKQGGQ